MILLEPGPPSVARLWLNARKLAHAVPPEITLVQSPRDFLSAIRDGSEVPSALKSEKRAVLIKVTVTSE
jgi:hypothetical protein